MSLEKEYYKELIKGRLSVLIGATYDVRFYKEALKDSLDQDDEVLREELADKKVELGNLMQARAVAERKKGALIPEDSKRLDELTDRVNELGGKGGKIDKIMEAKATMVALEEKLKNSRKYYEFAKARGKEILNSIEE